MAITCRVCRAENEHFGRRCTSCGAELSQVCPTCAAVNEPAARFCSHCGSRLDQSAAEQEQLHAKRLRGYLPKDLAERFLLAGSQLEGERRQVTVLFIDLAQSTELVRELGAERMSELLEELLGAIAGAIYSLEGTVVDFAGDGALCLFGAPIAHEDDPERALRAAIAVRAAVHEIGARVGRALAVRIGAHSGEVVVRAIGRDFRLKYSAIGDAVNLAHRLQNAADPGQILVSPATQRLAATAFRFGPPMPYELKGFEQRVEAAPLLAAHDTAERRAVTATTAFVGRDAELADLRDRLTDLERGVGAIVTVWGEAGMGKSRLVAEARRHATAGTAWLEGRALSYAQAAPYQVLAQQLRRAAGITLEDGREAARTKLESMVTRESGPEAARRIFPFIANVLELPLDAEDDALVHRYAGDQLQRELFRALRELLVSAARRVPLVLVCEDAHWSDPASAATIGSLLSLAEDERILFLLIARPDPSTPAWALRQKIETLHARRHTSISVGPLSRDASAGIAQSVLGGAPLPDEIAAVLYEKSEGVPLFIEELTRSLVEQGLLTRMNGAWRLGVSTKDLRVPDTVQGVILSRIDLLDDEPKALLQLASVIGRVFTRGVLTAVTGADDGIDERLRELERRDFIREGPRRPRVEYVFKHALIQDVTYQSLLAQRRRELHRRVAEAAEGLFRDRLGEYRTLVAEHFFRAEAWERAADHYFAAARAAERLYAYVEARQHYAKVLDALAHLPDSLGHRRAKIDAVLGEAQTSVVAVGGEANLRRLAEIEPVALALAEETMAAEDRVRVGHLRHQFGRAQYLAGRQREAMASFREAMAIGQQHADERLSTIPAGFVGQALIVIGQFGRSAALLSDALARMERLADPLGGGGRYQWMGYLGVALTAIGRCAEGLASAERGLAGSQALGGPTGIGQNLILLSGVHVLRADARALFETSSAAIDVGDRARDRVVTYAGHGFRAWAEARMGDYERAAKDMARCFALGAELGAQIVIADWFAAADAELALARGRGADAVAKAEHAIEIGGKIQSAFSPGLAHRTRGLAIAALDPSRRDEAERDLAQSIALLRSGDCAVEVARTHREWGALLARLGDSGGEHLLEALAAFEAAGLAAEADETRRLLAAVAEPA